MIIYKITNLLNNKSYIGKTNNFDRRKREHFSSTALQNEPNKILYLAIEKYGKENFLMEIVEECKDDVWEEREKFYIQYYHTLTPNGYNMIDGGTEPSHYSGEECPAAKLNWELVYKIVDIIKNTNYREKQFKEIAKDFNISVDQILRINKGLVWRIEGEQYPLRKTYLEEEQVEEIKILLSTWEYTCEEIGIIYGKSKSTIKAINNGQNWFKPDTIYPIKPPNVFASKKTYKEVKKLLEEQDLTQSQIAKKLNISSTLVKRVSEGKFDKYLTCND